MAIFGTTAIGQDNKELVLDDVLKSTDITKFCTVLENIKYKQLITTLGDIEKVTYADGGCGVGGEDITLPVGEYTWDPTEMKSQLQFCAKGQRDQLIAYGLGLGYSAANVEDAIIAVKMGISNPEETVSLSEILIDKVKKATIKDIIRQAWFNDTAIAKVSGGGVLSNAVDTKHYNSTNGFFKQLFTIVSGDAARKYAITENGLSTYALQDALAADRAKEIYKNLYYGCTELLSQADNKVIITTRSLVNNWEQSQSASAYRESDKGQLSNGQYYYTYNGVPLIVVNEIDRYVKSDFINGTKYTMPRHFALMTTLDNILLGFDTSNPDTMTEFWYEKKDEKFIIRTTYTVDPKFAKSDLIQVAY